MTLLTKDEPEICESCGEHIEDCQCYNEEEEEPVFDDDWDDSGSDIDNVEGDEDF
jgi:hypothetical protein